MISIVVPVYNAAEYLDDCIKSILSQSYTDFELILINDGSRDNSLKICEEYSLKDSRIKVYTQENAGVSSARNVGVSFAKGEYITFIDSDDIVSDKLLETLYSNIVDKNCELSICGLEIVYTNRIGLDEKLQIDSGIYSKEKLLKGFFDNKILKDLLYGPYNKLYITKLVRELQFDEKLRLGEDLLFVFSYLQKIKKSYLCNDILYSYIKRENSATTSEFTSKKMDYVIACEKILTLSRCQNNICVYEAELWYFINVLNHTRMLNGYKDVRKEFEDLYFSFNEYLKINKNKFWKNLTTKNKMNYIVCIYAPWVFSCLKFLGYKI